jgi:hypothetical protein
LVFENKSKRVEIGVSLSQVALFHSLFYQLGLEGGKKELTFGRLEEEYNRFGMTDFGGFLRSEVWQQLREEGLVLV